MPAGLLDKLVAVSRGTAVTLLSDVTSGTVVLAKGVSATRSPLRWAALRLLGPVKEVPNRVQTMTKAIKTRASSRAESISLSLMAVILNHRARWLEPGVSSGIAKATSCCIVSHFDIL